MLTSLSKTLQNNWQRFGLFSFIGVLNSAVDFATFSALVYLLHVAPLISNIISFCCGAACSYTLNSIMTFRDRHTKLRDAKRVLRFFLVSVITLSFSTFSLWVALFFTEAVFAKLVSIAATVLLSYSLNNLYVFRTTKAI